jgi:hypothetical protein
MSFILNSHIFHTKAALERKLRDILWVTEVGHTVTPAQQDLLLDLFKWHPDWEEKTLGQPPLAVKVDLPPVSYHRCFHVIRHDGSAIDISFHKAISGLVKSNPGAKKKTKQQLADEFVKGEVSART